MIWLAPAAAILGAALALPALAAIYMLRLRRRPVRVSAAGLWIEAAEDLEANVPLRWLRASWLLLVQAIALALLVLALGRPAWPASGPEADRAVLLIDVSASMRAATDATNETRFERAIERARELVRSVGAKGGPGAMAIIAVGADPRAITPMTTQRRELERALDALRPTDEPDDLPAALELASALVRGAGEGDDATAAIWIIGDGGHDPSERLAAPGEVVFISVAPDDGAETGNIGLLALAARRDYTDPALVRVLASVGHADARERSTVIRLTLDGAELQRRALTLPPASDDALSERAIAFDVLTAAGGVLEASLAPGGSLRSDDRAAITLQPARRPRLVWVTPDGEPRPSGGPRDWVLGDVLDAVGAASVTRTSASETGALDADLLILDRAAPPSPDTTPSLAFVAPTEDEPPTPTRVVTWDREHPALRHAPLDQLIVRAPAALATPPEGVARTVLARGADGPLIVEDAAPGVRRLVVAFDPLDTDWPLQPGFAVFVASSIDYLTLRAERETGAAWRTGEAVTLPAPSGSVELIDPEGGPVPVDVRDGRASFRPSRAGLYRLRAPGLDTPIAVQLSNATETAARASPTLTVSGRSLETGASSAGPREIWRWLVAAAGVLLILEWLVYIARSRG